MSNYTIQNLVPIIAGEGRIPAIKVGDIIFLAAVDTPIKTPVPYVLFVSNDQAFNGNYIATSDSFNNAPVYELTQ